MIPIRPEHIDTAQHFWNAFDNMERELSANWIVTFCQDRGEGWAPFTVEEIERFCQAHGGMHFHLDGLDEYPQRYGIIKRERDGRYEIRPQFVARCYGASPAAGAGGERGVELKGESDNE